VATTRSIARAVETDTVGPKQMHLALSRWRDVLGPQNYARARAAAEAKPVSISVEEAEEPPVEAHAVEEVAATTEPVEPVVDAQPKSKTQDAWAEFSYPTGTGSTKNAPTTPIAPAKHSQTEKVHVQHRERGPTRKQRMLQQRTVIEELPEPEVDPKEEGGLKDKLFKMFGLGGR
jgi:hypothetical protein